MPAGSNKKQKKKANELHHNTTLPIHQNTHGNSKLKNHRGDNKEATNGADTDGKVKPAKSVRRQRKRMKMKLAQESGVPLSQVMQIPNAELTAAKTQKRTKKANARKRKRQFQQRNENRNGRRAAYNGGGV